MRASYPAQELSSSTQSGSSRQRPGLGEGAAGSALRARSPDPAQPSSMREPGGQDPAGPQAFHLTWRESFVYDRQEYVL